MSAEAIESDLIGTEAIKLANSEISKELVSVCGGAGCSARTLPSTKLAKRSAAFEKLDCVTYKRASSLVGILQSPTGTVEFSLACYFRRVSAICGVDFVREEDEKSKV